MSKRDKMEGRLGVSRSQGSTYNNNLVLGDDFLSAVTETDTVQQENAELKDTLNRSLVTLKDGSKRFQRFGLRATSLELPADVTPEEIDALGFFLASVGDAVQFWRGDWVNLYVPQGADDRQRSEIYAELSERFGIGHSTLKNEAWVCRTLDASLRSDALSFSHHKEVAGLPAALKGREAEFLQIAESESLSVRALRQFIADQALPSGEATIIDKPMLFDPEHKPNLSRIERQWAAARRGDEAARQKLREDLEQTRHWLDEIESSLED